MKILFWTEPYSNIKRLQNIFLGRQCIFIAGHNVEIEFIRELKNAGFQKCILPVDIPQQSVFERSYIELIGELSEKYKSLQWWVCTLSEKNEHFPLLYCNLYFYYVIMLAIETLPQQELLVVTDRFMARHLNVLCKVRKIRFVDCSYSIRRFVSVTLDIVRTFYLPLVFIAESFRRKLMVNTLLSGKIRQSLQQTSGKKRYVIRSFINERIDRYDSSIFNPFFGNLPSYVIQRGYSLVILASIISCFDRVVNTLRHNWTATIIPEEYILRWSDFLAALWQTWCNRIIIREPVVFLGYDVTSLINEEICRSFTNLNNYRNYLTYRIGLRFGKLVLFDIYIQTFENYAWEKMMIIGLREALGSTCSKILGFQHAFISRSSFKYFPGVKEKDILPLSDRIITLGERTAMILSKYGCYPKNLIVTGCALRQEYLHSALAIPRNRGKRLMVPLTMVFDECRRIVQFIMNSGLIEEFTVNFRCHPFSLPFKAFTKGLDVHIRHSRVTFDNNQSVQDELAESSVVLYTWSMVAIEAVYQGIPSIYLDILQPMYVDPLFECPYLKRTVAEASKLKDAVWNLLDMDDVSFEREHQAAKQYLEKYFYKVNAINLEKFF